MKIYKARAPMRIGFFGGGTDVSPYAEEHGGKVLNCTINLFVRCMIAPSADPGITAAANASQTQPVTRTRLSTPVIPNCGAPA